MFKIGFYHANTLYFEKLENTLFLSVAAIYFKTHVEINAPDIACQLEWIRPIQKQISDQELIDYCNNNNLDMLAISMYLWNENYIKNQLKRIKNKISSKCKIIVGGPSVDVNINDQYFTQHDYADFAIYGPGEVAFTDLLTHLVLGKRIIPFNVSNIAWVDKQKNKLIVADYKNVPQSKVSPFLYNEEFFTLIVKHEQQQNGVYVVLPWELTRGCPYSCTFCDWNSGLSNKVTRRKGTYKDEIDLFHKLEIKKIYFSDANFGQYEEDIEIVEYLVYKNLHENAGFKTDGNLSKLKKDNNLKIYHMFAQGNLVHKGWGFTFSVQDTNETVLQNIERPDVGWDVHKKMILELSEHHPQYLSKVQFIIGLPGQTPQTIIESLSQIIDLPNVVLSPFISELLPASPAGRDPEYQQKFNFQYSSSERINQSGLTFRGKFPASCYSFNNKEFVEMIVITSFMSGLARLREEINFKELTVLKNTKIIVNKFLASAQFKFLCDNLYNNWINKDKFYYTIDFDHQEKILPGCNMVVTGIKWVNSISFKKMLLELNLENIAKNNLYKKIMTRNLILDDWFVEDTV